MSGGDHLPGAEPPIPEMDRAEYVTRLMRMAAHDLNNILSPILGYPELLMDSFSEGAPEREDLEEIRRLAGRAISLIKDVQMLLRSELRDPKPCDFTRVIQNRIQSRSMRSEIQERLKQVNVKLQLSEDLPKVSSNSNALASVFDNLFAASLFMVAESGDVTLTTQAVGDQVEIEFSFPVGQIEDEEADRLLEPFFLRKRFSNSLSGLELAVVFELSAQHGGTLSAALNAGTCTLTCRLPQAAETTPASE